MSTEIFYDKMFIAVPEKKKFIPIIFAGSNNCYQYDLSSRGRRARSWFLDTYMLGNKAMMATEEEILQRIEETREDYKRRHEDYNDNNFGYFAAIAIGSMGSRSTFGQYKGIYTTGMRKALTIEQLLEVNITVVVEMRDYNQQREKEAAAKNHKWFGTTEITSTQHLLDTIELYSSTYDGTPYNWTIGFQDGDRLEWNIKRIRAKYFPTAKNKPKEWIDVDHYFTVKTTVGAYFQKFTRYGYKYSFSYPQRKFQTEKEAQAYVNKYKDRLGLVVERIEGRDRLLVRGK